MSVVQIGLGGNIQAAINANPAGTVFQLAAGTYRGEQFEPQSNDQFIGAPNGGTILSGAVVLNQWTQSGSYWVASGLPPQLVGQSVSGSSAMASDLNDLFINNTLYTRVSSLSQVTGNTWYFDPSTNSVYISTNPTGQTVEYGVTPSMTYNNGATGVVFKNIATEKYATDAQSAPIQTGTGWSIIDVTSTQNHGAGLYVGGAGTIVQGGKFDSNGQVGIEGSNANGSEVLGAQINGNNYAGYNTGWDAGGLKITATSGLLVSGNTVDNNNGQGIWADIDSSNWTVSDNTVANNGGNGIMYEISHGTTNINNNIVTNNSGSGLYISNSDGVNAFDNTVTVNPNNVFNSIGAAIGGGIDVINNSGRGNDPNGTPYQAINDSVHNNTIIQANSSAQNGIWAYQALPSNPNDVFTANTYYMLNATGTFWHFGNTDYTWSSLKQSGTYESSGVSNVGLPSSTFAPTAITIGSGPDNLTLLISENAYANGDKISDATFTVSINGVRQGTTFTAQIAHTAGADQVFSFDGYFGTGPHNIVVTFMNDAYNPAAPDANGSYDRNLYVDGIIYNGSDTGQVAALDSNGSHTFTVTGGTAAPAFASPNGTMITSATASPIIDKAGDAWSLVQSAASGLQIAVNSVVDPITANVVLLETLNGNMVQENASGNWYSEAGSNGAWQYIAAPAINVTNNATGATTAVSGATIGTKTADGATFALSAPGVAKVALGNTSDTLNFVGLSSVKLTGGTAAAAITADGGTNTFTAGVGALTMTGGVGADAYIYHAGNGLMTMKDFSFTKGDSLTVDKSLQSAMTEKSDGHGGVIVGFGTTSHGVDLIGVTSITASQIHFV